MLNRLVAIAILGCQMAISSPTSSDDTFEITLIHNNDMHGHFEQSDSAGNMCTKEDAEANKCYGGFARHGYLVRKERAAAKRDNRPILFLNGGDTFTGTLWFQIYTVNISVEFLNLLMPDTACLGNHEFDLNETELSDFIDRLVFPLVVANVEFTEDSELSHTKNLHNYLIFEFGKVRVGVIGYLTPETKSLEPETVGTFFDEIEVINKMAEELKKLDVNIIIVLGHSGIVKDKEIAAKCEDVDVVVGAHSHTFLYTGPVPSTDKSEGPYPTVITQASGKEVIVVQCSAMSKYLCILNLTFDGDGNLTKWAGKPILLDFEIPQDPEFVEALEKYRPGIEQFQHTILGETAVYLDGSSCRKNECNMGDFVTDAFLAEYSESLQTTPGDPICSDVATAFSQGGGLRSSINIGNITQMDLVTALPFRHIIGICSVTGADIMKMLERSVERYQTDVGRGEFLQMSGAHVVYDVAKEPLHRVVSVKLREPLMCDVIQYEDLDETRDYKILISWYLQMGGDGYDMLKNNKFEKLPLNDYEVVSKYMQSLKTPIDAQVEGRITFANSGPVWKSATSMID